MITRYPNPSSVIDPDIGVGDFVCNMPEGWAIAQGFLQNHQGFRAYGYDSSIASGMPYTDVTGSAVTNVTLLTTATNLEVVSTSANDAATLITSGTSTGGSTTTLIDTGKNFVSLGVVAGDVILNDTSDALGVVVTRDSATQLTFTTVADATFSGIAYRIARTTGTGAGIVEHHGLDANWVERSEFIIMNGVTPVACTIPTIRSNNLHVMNVGTNLASVGDIKLRIAGAGAQQNFIGNGGNMSLQCHYTVPTGKVAYITSWHGGSSGNKPLRIVLHVQADFLSKAYMPGVFHIHDVIVANNTDTQHKFDLPIKVPARASMKVSASVIGTGTGECGCGIEYWLENA